MMENIVDARGKPCPQPLIMTKASIKECGQNQSLTILVDNETAKNNVERFLSDNGLKPIVTRSGAVFSLQTNTTGQALQKPDAAAYCTPEPRNTRGHAIVFAGDKMGTGADELGAILIKAFISTIKEVAPLPATIAFYNSGIFLALEGSTVIEPLKELAAKGVEILVCGTCVNYYNKQGAVAVGTVSNLYTILEALSAASSVIRP